MNKEKQLKLFNLLPTSDLWMELWIDKKLQEANIYDFKVEGEYLRLFLQHTNGEKYETVSKLDMFSFIPRIRSK